MIPLEVALEAAKAAQRAALTQAAKWFDLAICAWCADDFCTAHLQKDRICLQKEFCLKQGLEFKCRHFEMIKLHQIAQIHQ